MSTADREREMVAALREALQVIHDDCGKALASIGTEATSRLLLRVLADTAQAASDYTARVRAEAFREAAELLNPDQLNGPVTERPMTDNDALRWANELLNSRASVLESSTPPARHGSGS